jgi:NADH dehydrogenase
MRNELVTVFGGSGFLGRHTVRALARAGYRIRVAVRRPHAGFFLKPAGTVGQIQVVKANVDDADQVAAAVAGAHIVINLTGVLFSRGTQSFTAIHEEGAGMVAKAAAAAGAQTLIHVSAIGADPDSDSAYARSKGEGERRVREAFPGAVILRPSLLFGPEDGFFNKFANLARYAPALPLIGGGHTRFQPAFVGDVAAAIVQCAGNRTTAGHVYELGGPTTYSFKDLMRIVLQETDRKRLLVPLPFFIGTLLGFGLSLFSMLLFFLPLASTPLLTMDQVKLLKHDNIASGEGFAALGIVPTSVEAEVPSYLWRYRARGQFQDSAAERATGAPSS